ncbi:MAG TPA: TIGR03943 family protein [Actinophytocola sp.]|uniref:TIGR03943 family putative permease subunit n=1 Tax=Actinophytocola sp. TaxID=1872138 RepID=UPI002DB91896|nr:TIGR03943 family protein [Actinophytocola sp.]HEU5474405.1 TIGR03943 family protein [Actinophytocola sp.]
MRRETQNILLLLLGGALLKIAFTGTYLRYVKPSHQWLLIAGGAVMVLLALVSLVRRPGSGHGDEGHQHSSRGAWLLLLPVFAVFLVAPPALGSDSVQRSGSAVAAGDGMEAFAPLPPGDAIPVSVGEFAARAAWDTGDSLTGRAVTLTGFVVQDGGASYLARLSIGCCAADAFPTKVRLDDAPEAAGLRDDTWIEAVVTLVPGSARRDNDYTPAATATSIRVIPAPEDPYEH